MPTSSDHPGDVAIRVEGLGKRYRLGARRERADTLRDALAGLVRVRERSGGAESLWALREVTLEVRHGEVVGIIGGNGAGKSTLLKILSQITEPTTGRAELHGRVGSLLEVGTGFHPELTGRENIYLNGAILGMRRKEIEREFDAIVAFADIERFLDTPVKRYSSGMYVRLAFSVAAHLEPEILLVDEVLAVGDVAFQRKCLGKMGEVARQGRTVLFVSHNMAAIQGLCDRAVLLHGGLVAADGRANDTVAEYLRLLEEVSGHDLEGRTERSGRGRVRLTAIDIGTAPGAARGVLVSGKTAQFVFWTDRSLPGLSCGFTIYDQHGHPVAICRSSVATSSEVGGSDGPLGMECAMDELLLVPGRYRISVAVTAEGVLQDHMEAATFFRVEPGPIRGQWTDSDGRWGSVHIPHRWHVRCG